MMHHLAHVASAAAKAACGGAGQAPCHHITYLEAVVTGIFQGVSELFPVSSLGHNVLLPALIGGNWAKALDVSAKDSPYLAFIVGLHVATAVAMIAYFWRDWLRIISGFISSLRKRSATTPDERLAWMIILATIPVGLAGLVLQKEVTKVFAKPELAAAFLAVNGLILMTSERMRRSRQSAGGTADTAGAARMAGAAAQPAFDGPGGRPPQGYGYSQQPWQQQQQGPGNREGDWGYGAQDGQYGRDQHGQDQYGRGSYGQGRHGRDQYGQGQYGQDQYGQDQYGQDQYGRGSYGQGQYEQGGYGQGQYERGAYGQGQYDPRSGRGGGQAPDPRAGQARRQGQEAWGGQDPWGGTQDPWAERRAADPRGQRAAERHGGHGPDGRHGTGAPGQAAETDHAVAADRRLSTMGYKRAVLVGSAQILALMPGISRDGIVTVAGMWRGIRREDAVRFSFLLSAPIILAAGALKMHDLTGPMGKGSHGPMVVGALIAGVSAFLSIRFLTKYFSEDKSLNPFGIYCIVAGVGSLAYLLLVK